MYDVKSKKAEEFINDSEILSTLDMLRKTRITVN
jgi:hypothetical protein